MKDYEQPSKVEFNKGRPFGIFISGLGQYNEGQLTGKWLYLPASKEEWKDALEAAGVGDKDSFGQPYEEYFITDTDIYCDPLIGKIGEYENLDSLQLLAEKIDQMTDYEYEAFCTYAKAEDLNNIADIYSLACNADTLEGENYYFYPDVHDDTDLGYYVVEELVGGVENLPKEMRETYFDYEGLGRDLDFDTYEVDVVDEFINPTNIEFYINWNNDESRGDLVDIEDAMKYDKFTMVIPENGKDNQFVVFKNIDLERSSVFGLAEFLQNDSYIQNNNKDIKAEINKLVNAVNEYGMEDSVREADASEYFCGEPNASHKEIGYAAVDLNGFEWLNGEYFNYKEYGRIIDLESQGEFTDNGYIEIVETFTPSDELKEDLEDLHNNNSSIIPSYNEMCKHFENKQKNDKNKVVDSIKPEKPTKSESLGKDAR